MLDMGQPKSKSGHKIGYGLITPNDIKLTLGVISHKKNITSKLQLSLFHFSFGKAVILSESETDSVGAVDEESSQIEVSVVDS